MSALWAGTAILAFGVLLYVQENGNVDLSSRWLLAGFGGCLFVALLAMALGRKGRREDPVEMAAEEALSPFAAEVGRDAGRLAWAGVAVGLLISAGLVYLWSNGALEDAGSAALAALIVTIALGLLSAPLWLSMVRRLGSERVARARSEERAEVAAHLHDSVLQTLALMQKRAGDPDEVAKLARRQERELRSWLAGEGPSRPSERLADALRATAVDVEESHGAPVEAVVVGDAPLDERREALVAATREALTNAAKFAADGGPVRLYAEIEDGSARVWVDDRGPGFDPDSIPKDRRGVRESIIGRMERFGGRAEIRSEPGDGTEVELSVKGNGR
jgi:signal transduction histidine kinase